MKKNHKLINIIVLVLATSLILYFTLKDNFVKTLQVIKNMNLFWIIISFLLMFIYWIFRSISFQKLTQKFNQKYSLKSAFKIIMSSNFFNGITPFSSGSQPFQVYMLKKDNVKLSNGTNVIIQNFISYQIALLILALIAIFCNMLLGQFIINGLMFNVIIIGFIINIVITVGLFIVSFVPKLNEKIVNFIVKVLSFLRIVKDKGKTKARWYNSLSSFHKGAIILFKNKKDFFLNVFYNLMALIFYSLIPLTLLYSTGNYENFGMLIAINASSLVAIVGSYVPLPGGSGGLEWSFIYFFGQYVPNGPVQAMMLIWRFITYHFGMIAGGISLNINKRRNKTYEKTSDSKFEDELK